MTGSPHLAFDLFLAAVAIATTAAAIVQSVRLARARLALISAEEKVDTVNAALGGHVQFLKVRRNG